MDAGCSVFLFCLLRFIDDDTMFGSVPGNNLSHEYSLVAELIQKVFVLCFVLVYFIRFIQKVHVVTLVGHGDFKGLGQIWWPGESL